MRTHTGGVLTDLLGGLSDADTASPIGPYASSVRELPWLMVPWIVFGATLRSQVPRTEPSP